MNSIPHREMLCHEGKPIDHVYDLNKHVLTCACNNECLFVQMDGWLWREKKQTNHGRLTNMFSFRFQVSSFDFLSSSPFPTSFYFLEAHSLIVQKTFYFFIFSE